jgi:hypothetical protein
LFTKLKKCNFSINTTNFLSYVISPDGLKMDNSKIQVICDWRTPHKVTDIQSFLSFANFYCQFITSYSSITIPLTHLTHKNIPWEWLPACNNAFRTLKDTFTSAPILCHFDPTLSPIVETDTSDYAIARILSLHTDDGDIHPVAFFSHTLTGAELNYDIHNKELLAM